ncbi:hypothetical protein, partial [Microcystis sp. M158S2]|uniref:hypothetical protein n=1 Tax=Microcystis sp. M158S2 TaxID=2771152 RepID=UPI00258944D6
LCLNHRLNGRLITVWWIFRNAIAVLCRGLRRSLYSVIEKMGIGDRINLNQIKSKISNLASSDPCHYIRSQF